MRLIGPTVRKAKGRFYSQHGPLLLCRSLFSLDFLLFALFSFALSPFLSSPSLLYRSRPYFTIALYPVSSSSLFIVLFPSVIVLFPLSSSSSLRHRPLPTFIVLFPPSSSPSHCHIVIVLFPLSSSSSLRHRPLPTFIIPVPLSLPSSHLHHPRTTVIVLFPYSSFSFLFRPPPFLVVLFPILSFSFLPHPLPSFALFPPSSSSSLVPRPLFSLALSFPLTTSFPLHLFTHLNHQHPRPKRSAPRGCWSSSTAWPEIQRPPTSSTCCRRRTRAAGMRSWLSRAAAAASSSPRPRAFTPRGPRTLSRPWPRLCGSGPRSGFMPSVLAWADASRQRWVAEYMCASEAGRWRNSFPHSRRNAKVHVKSTLWAAGALTTVAPPTLFSTWERTARTRP